MLVGRTGHRQRRGVEDAPLDGRHVHHLLTGDQRVARPHRVAQADLDRIEPARGGQPVHLRLVGEARLHDPEAPHRPARQVVRPHGVPVDDGVGAAVRALGVRDAVDEHRRRRGGVRPAVEHHARLDLDDLALARGVVAHPDRRRVAVDVAEEALGSAVGDAHRPPEPQRQQARVDLQADVLACAERAADATEHEPDGLVGQAEAGGDLVAVLVEPLGGDVQLDTLAAGVRHGERGLEPEERLVLHADLVRALDDDVTDHALVAAHDALVTDDVPVGMDRRMAAVDRGLGVEQRIEQLVVDDDRREGAPARLRMIGGHRGDRLAHVAHDVGREHGLVLADQPVRTSCRARRRP